MSSPSSYARAGQVAGLGLGLLLASGAVFQASSAAFSDTTTNGSNTFAAGVVSLVDDDTASVLFQLTDLVPGDTFTECIELDYTGTTYDVTPVKLYAAENSNVDSFADHLDVTIKQGSGGEFGDCTGFTADSTLTTATALSTVTSTYTDFASGMTVYTPDVSNTSKTVEFTVTLGADTPNTAQGDAASATFTWEIQSD